MAQWLFLTCLIPNYFYSTLVVSFPSLKTWRYDMLVMVLLGSTRVNSTVLKLYDILRFLFYRVLPNWECILFLFCHQQCTLSISSTASKNQNSNFLVVAAVEVLLNDPGNAFISRLFMNLQIFRMTRKDWNKINISPLGWWLHHQFLNEIYSLLLVNAAILINYYYYFCSVPRKCIYHFRSFLAFI